MTTEDPLPPVNSLVLYHGKPARVSNTGARLEIELAGGERVKVRAKDVELLHPGPLKSLDELKPLPGEMRAAWEILAGQDTTLQEAAELAFGAWTPQTAWAAWQFASDGMYFNGSPKKLHAAAQGELSARQAERDAQAQMEREWRAFLERARAGKRDPGDERYLKEVEQLAYGSSNRSRALRELGRAETPENAHALLLETRHWDRSVDPHPRRLNLPLLPPDLSVPELPDEERRDLTSLPAFAIDDEGSDTPDDAIGLEGERVWVHVADVAALAPVESLLDVEARGRGETLHLPEGHIHLFPPRMTALLGLGMQAVSPALSFGIDLGDDGSVAAVEVVPSWVRVERLTYETANLRMDAEHFNRLEAKMDLRRRRREANGAINIDLPEVNIHVQDGCPEISPVLTLRSRRMVEEAMILAGDAVAGYAAQRRIPLPFSNQDPPDGRIPFDTLSGMFAMRRLLRRSQYRAQMGPHSGLGLPGYVQVTSPLRRYLDLVVHQQLRASLRGAALLDEGALLERIGAVEAVLPALRQAELRAEKHWTLVYLLHHPGERWEGVLVDRRGASGTMLIPALALEARVHLAGSPALDAILPLEVSGVNLPDLEVYFNVSAR